MLGFGELVMLGWGLSTVDGLGFGWLSPMG